MMRDPAIPYGWEDHEYVDCDGGHWHLIVVDYENYPTCVDIRRSGRVVYGVGWFTCGLNDAKNSGMEMTYRPELDNNRLDREAA